MSLVAVVLIVVVVGIVLLYAFCGPFSFIFYFLGLLYSSFMFPIELINRIIYPVGWLPSLIWAGSLMFFAVLLISKFITTFIKR